MSVLVLSTEVIQEIANTLCVMASNNREFDKEHPHCVSSLFKRNDINPNEPLDICKIVALWWQHNQDTWEAKHGNKAMLDYNEEDVQRTAEALVEYHEAHWAHPAKVVQLYKWIGCLSYNIGLEGWGAQYGFMAKQDGYKSAVKLLNDLENALAQHIVAQLDEYKNAKYSEV